MVAAGVVAAVEDGVVEVEVLAEVLAGDDFDKK